ncbi:DUF1488 domain-containing protein [Veronia pacifica]|uniref:Transcriptional regulator n=1 Tax=Veronia pacifica TaxID=1080227 RepID=A0A1C3EFJ0_9GAMM|nr:DUF1488 domain-containing protein [Veronia pacifica]ODA31980.1 transcriptional regulator [Veronia pacifica]
MNQSILFPDLQSYVQDKHAVSFPAQLSGALIPCFVAVTWLEAKSGRDLTESDEILAAFQGLRFDLEDAAEQAIEDEMFNEQGEVWLS